MNLPAMRPSFKGYLRELETTERLSPTELAAHQAPLLQRILRHAHANVPFYRDRLACLFGTDGRIDPTRWKDVPVLRRSEAAAHTEQMRTPNLAEEYGPVGEFSTSGSMAMPLKVAVNGMVSMNANASIARLARWFGMDTGRSLASIKTFASEEARFPDGKTFRNWIAGERGPNHALNVATPVSQQLEWLARVRAHYLLTYPSNAFALAEAVTPEAGRALGIEAIIGFAETVPLGARELIAERFGARMASYYSCREVGTIGIECPVSARYHVTLENVLVEILDNDGREVPLGSPGNVVVTGLLNYAMPFIRYEIGDVAVAAQERCACGRMLPLLERVEGRTRNAFTFRDGTRMWPRGWMVREMQAFVPFRQYQLVQLDFERIELRYVPDGSGREPDRAGLSAFAKRMLHESVEIGVAPMESLPRGPGGKFEDILSLVPTGAREESLRI